MEFESQKKRLQRDIEDLELEKSSSDRKKAALEEELTASNNQVSRLQVNSREYSIEYEVYSVFSDARFPLL